MAGDFLEGQTKLYVDLAVNVKEMRDWTPERIKQFFDGLAKLLNASVKVTDSVRPAD